MIAGTAWTTSTALGAWEYNSIQPIQPSHMKSKGQQILVNKKGDAVAKPTVNLARCCRNSIDSNFLETQFCRRLEVKTRNLP